MKLVPFLLGGIQAAATLDLSAYFQNPENFRQFPLFQSQENIQQLSDKINSKSGVKWQAGINWMNKEEKASDYQHLMGTRLGAHPTEEDLPIKPKHLYGDYDLPKSFDPAQKWPECEHSLTMIRDQGSCGSCWAFGAAEAMSDRVCIASGGEFHGDISSEDILACCGWRCGNGCNGGWPLMAFKYFKSHGVVTGGLYGDKKSGCLPYEIEPCEHHTTGPRPSCTGEEGHTPKCPKKCIAESGLDWKTDKHYAVSAYRVPSDEDSIMRELFEHGPVEAAITVYEDFMAYKGGVYHHVEGKALGGHAIRLVGWGEEDDGTKYWVLANSWNSDWGENGYFRMLRGENECGVEGENVGGIAEPKAFRQMFDSVSDNRL